MRQQLIWEIISVVQFNFLPLYCIIQKKKNYSTKIYILSWYFWMISATRKLFSLMIKPQQGKKKNPHLIRGMILSFYALLMFMPQFPTRSRFCSFSSISVVIFLNNVECERWSDWLQLLEFLFCAGPAIFLLFFILGKIFRLLFNYMALRFM